MNGLRCLLLLSFLPEVTILATNHKSGRHSSSFCQALRFYIEQTGARHAAATAPLTLACEKVLQPIQRDGCNLEELSVLLNGRPFQIQHRKSGLNRVLKVESLHKSWHP